MSDQPVPQRDEKPEKKEEKDEKERHEKNWDEKWRSDPLAGVAWALILIWAGLVFLAQTMNQLPLFGRVGPWTLIFAGAGVIVLAIAGLRLAVPRYARPITGAVILGIILIAVALGDLFSWAAVWAVVLIALGAFLLLRGVLRGR